MRGSDRVNRVWRGLKATPSWGENGWGCVGGAPRESVGTEVSFSRPFSKGLGDADVATRVQDAPQVGEQLIGGHGHVRRQAIRRPLSRAAGGPLSPRAHHKDRSGSCR